MTDNDLPLNSMPEDQDRTVSKTDLDCWADDGGPAWDED